MRDTANSSKHSEHRQLQNRIAAKKCRMKKKEEFSKITDALNNLGTQNKQLKKTVSTILYLIKLHY